MDFKMIEWEKNNNNRKQHLSRINLSWIHNDGIHRKTDRKQSEKQGQITKKTTLRYGIYEG